MELMDILMTRNLAPEEVLVVQSKLQPQTFKVTVLFHLKEEKVLLQEVVEVLVAGLS